MKACDGSSWSRNGPAQALTHGTMAHAAALSALIETLRFVENRRK